MYSNYIEHVPIMISKITACVSISLFALFVGIPRVIAISVVGLKLCVTTVGIKKYKSIIKEKGKKHGKNSINIKRSIKSRRNYKQLRKAMHTLVIINLFF